MGGFIVQCCESKECLEAFNEVKALTKIQFSLYSDIKAWFLNNHANYSKQSEFDADGFANVNTKKKVEAEVKAQFEETAA